ncbi:MAG TPA: hypothetical protein VFW87_10370, partial [Pirellulales bacterium]|nr:hypothetical protein [Pirellulales bacterium]
PFPRISKLLRCASVAFAKRQDQTNGTLMVRPSTSRAVIKSSVTSIDAIRASLFAAMLIPGLDDRSQIVRNDRSNSIQFFRRKAVVVR